MLVRVTMVAKTIIPKRSITRTIKSAPREQLLRYQTLFAPEIDGMDHLEKFNPSKFTLYNEK